MDLSRGLGDVYKRQVKDSYDKLSSVTETHTLDFRRGQMDILNWLYGLKEAYGRTYKDLQETGEV
jgi:hypothetical protein